jgi:chorismate mutase
MRAKCRIFRPRLLSINWSGPVNLHPELARLREKLDHFDEQLISILRQRFAIIDEIAVVKAENDLPVMDHQRVALLKESFREKLESIGVSHNFGADLVELLVTEACLREHAVQPLRREVS